MKNKRISTFIGFGAVLAIGLAILTYLSFFVQPQISFYANIAQINDADYSRILSNNQLPMPNSKDEFANIKVYIDVKAPVLLIKNIQINKDNLHEFFINSQNFQILSGGNYEDQPDNKYEDNIELFLGNTSKEDLVKNLKNYKVVVAWQDLLKQNYKRIFYLGDYVHIDK